jgi:chromosome segregation ATPase
MEEELAEVKSMNNALEKENAEQAQQIEDLEEALAAAEEKIELLEESEMRWREKNSALRVENEELRLVIDRLGSRVGDLETDMVKKILEIRKLKEDLARFERRRTLMLQKLEETIKRLEGAGMVKALFKIWQEDTAKEKLRVVKQTAEERRRQEVGELRDQLGQEKEHVLSLEATATRLRGNLKAAAQRMLMKVMSTTQKPWADGHALRVWCGTHETLRFENELERTQEELKETQEKLAQEQRLTERLSNDLEETTGKLGLVTKERDDLAANYAQLMTELQSTLGNMGQHATDVQKLAEEKAKAAREALIAEIWAQAQLKMDAMNKDFAEERLMLEDQVAGLEAQLEAIKRGLGGSKDDSDETRVVPRGQGILCVGCLKQIVNRGVKQLPPVSMPQPKSPRREAKNRKTFFQQELKGMPDPDDFLHSEVWSTRQDPLKGLRYADLSPELSWQSSTSTKSGSTSLPSLSRMKKEKIFKPSAFR